MTDLVRPLKIENPAEGGTQTDLLPTEMTPTQDYAAIAGVALKGNVLYLIDLNAFNQIQFKDAVDTTALTVRDLRTSLNSIFANSGTGITASNVQAALAEVVYGNEITSTTTFTTSSATYVVITGLTLTPPAGKYQVFFSGNGTQATSLALGYCAIFVSGSVLASSERINQAQRSSAQSIFSTQGTVSVNGSQAIDIRIHSNSGALTIDARSMLIRKVGP